MPDKIETTNPVAAAREEGRRLGLSEAYNLVAELVWQGDKSRKDDPEIVGDILDALGKIAVWPKPPASAPHSQPAT